MWFNFEMFTTEMKLVARGQASAVMVYEFQKTFIESIGPGNHSTKGSYITLDNLLARKVGEYSGWETHSVDGKFFKFFVERIS